MSKSRIYQLILVAALVFPTAAFAADILDLDGNSRPLGTSNVVNILTVFSNGGHTVNTGPLSELANNDILLLGEPTLPFTPAEIAEIESFVINGGFLLAIEDSGCTGCANTNDVLAGIGSAITVGGGSAGNAAPLPDTFFTSAPRNLVGQSFSLTPGTQVVSGNALIGDFGAYEIIGSGLVVVFGERVDFDGSNPTDGSSVNSQFLLNLADNATGANPPPPPGPATPVPVDHPMALLLLISLMLGFGLVTSRRL